MAVQYNFLDNSFTTYENVENPKVSIDLPLSNEPLNIDWASGISESGVPIAKNLVQPDKLIVNNNEETQEAISYNTSRNGNISNRVQYAKQFFMKKDPTLKNYQAAAIVGNLMYESGDPTLNTTTSVGDNKTSFGMAQWHDTSPGKGRWTNLKNFAKSLGKDSSDFETQLEFVWKELQENPKWLRHLKSSRNVDEATLSFMKNFENPNKSVANLTARLKHAKSALS